MGLNIIYGQIDAQGGIVRPGSTTSKEVLSAHHNGEGQYSVDIKSGIFDGTPVVVATVMTGDQEGGNGTNRTISVTEVSPTKICFGIRQASAKEDSSNRPFAFQAIGVGR